MNSVQKNKLYYTENYDRFKLDFCNRAINHNRVKQLENSIQKIGWKCNPILVNEKMQIIDGQHRFMALKNLQMPIEYSICDGTTIADARILNSSSKNWGTQDYIDSYAAEGNVNYINFKTLQKKYPKLKMTTIAGIVRDRIVSDGPDIKNGSLKLTAADLDVLYPIIDFIMENKTDIDRIEGRPVTVCSSLAWILRHTNVDRKRLCRILHESIFPPVSESYPKRFMESLSAEYNKRLKKEKQIKFDALYELSK